MKRSSIYTAGNIRIDLAASADVASAVLQLYAQSYIDQTTSALTTIHTVVIPRTSLAAGDQIVCCETKYKGSGANTTAEGLLYGFHAVNGVNTGSAAFQTSAAAQGMDVRTTITIISANQQEAVTEATVIPPNAPSTTTVSKVWKSYAVSLGTTDLTFTTQNQMPSGGDDTWTSHLRVTLFKAP